MTIGLENVFVEKEECPDFPENVPKCFIFII